MGPTVDYAPATVAAGSDALRLLADRFRARSDPPSERRTTYLDTFDWRIHRKAGTLELTRSAFGDYLYRRDPDGEILGRVALRELPRFVTDLPPSTLRSELEPILDVRCLFPVVEIRAATDTLCILDDEEKIVVRVALEDAEAFGPEPKRRREKLAPRLRVASVRGYDGWMDRVRRVLEDELALEKTDGEPGQAFRAIGSSPGDYTGKIRVPLDPEDRADAATRKILLALLDTVRRNEEGTRLDLDSEFLHDFRVAVRRTRTVLGQIREVLPQAELEKFRAEFAWLGSITGPTRDMDVYLLQMDAYRSELPEDLRGHLAPLETHLRQRQREEQSRLVGELDGERYRKLLFEWRRFLSRSTPRRRQPANAERPILEVAVERIRKVHRRVVREGRAAGENPPIEELHRLRIRCKKLRYLLEFFRSLFDAAELDRPISALKGLQNVLGDLNDLGVQTAHLGEFAEEMTRKGTAPPRTLLAMGRLVERLARRQERERRRFADRFRAFTEAEVRTCFRRMLRPPGEPKA